MTTEQRQAAIRTSYDPKPIPIRTFDWHAWVDGKEEGGFTGHGATENDAIESLKDQLEDSCFP